MAYKYILCAYQYVGHSTMTTYHIFFEEVSRSQRLGWTRTQRNFLLYGAACTVRPTGNYHTVPVPSYLLLAIETTIRPMGRIISPL
jgi:hypothetical protein